MFDFLYLAYQQHKVGKAKKRFEFDIENVRRQQRWQPKKLKLKDRIKQRLGFLYPPWREGFIPMSTYDLMFVAGTRPNAILRLFRNIMIIETLGLLIYLTFAFKYTSYPDRIGTYCAIFTHSVLAVMIVFPNLMKFSTISAFRMLSGKTRALLLLIMISISLEHNLMNATDNVTQVAQGIACVQLKVKEGRQKAEFALTHAMDMFNPGRFMDVQKWLGGPLGQVAEFMKATGQGIQRMSEWIRRQASSTAKIGQNCKEYFSGPYRKCLNAFNEGYMACQNSKVAYNGICKRIPKLSMICNGAQWWTDGICDLPELYKDLIVVNGFNFYKQAIMKAIGWWQNTITWRTYGKLGEVLLDVGSMDINFRGGIFGGNKTQAAKKHGRELLSRIKDEVAAYITAIKMCASFINYCMIPLTLLYPVLQTAYFVYRYNTKESFQNRFITQEVRKIERDRILHGKAGIFPLSTDEKKQYKSIGAWSMSLYERSQFTITFVLTLLYGIAPFMFISIDMIVYYGCYLAWKTIHISGKGFWADFLRHLLDIFSPMKRALEGREEGWRDCFAEPNPPNHMIISATVYMYFVALFLTRFEPWVTRYWICLADYFYPHRVRPRALYFYTHILAERRKAKALTENDTKEVLARDQLAGRDDIIRRGLQSRDKWMITCVKCIRQLYIADGNNSRLCFECGAFYCTQCFCFQPTCLRCGMNIQIVNGMELHWEYDSADDAGDEEEDEGEEGEGEGEEQVEADAPKEAAPQ